LARATERSDLPHRIGFTLGALIVYRAGKYVPLAGIDPHVLYPTFGRNVGSLLGMTDVFSGVSIFALGIYEYISASILVLFLTVVSRRLDALRNDGEAGRQKLDTYTLCGALALSALQAYGVAIGLERTGHSFVVAPGPVFRLSTVLTMTAATAILIWLANQITRRGLCNGFALMIFVDIVAGLPRSFASLFELGRTGAMSTIAIVFFLVVAVAVITFIVFMERAQRRIVVQYQPRVLRGMVFDGEGAHLRFKLNNAGIVPPLFASSLLLLPAGFARASVDQTGWATWIAGYISRGHHAYIVAYALLIIFFCFFYVAIVLSPKALFERLRRCGGAIVGAEQGAPTADYLDRVLTRITLLGGAYLVGICVLPEVLVNRYSLPFYFGGSSLLVLVCIALDLVEAVRAHLGPDRPAPSLTPGAH
jgi:preprotein translocase subunit SecY